MGNNPIATKDDEGTGSPAEDPFEAFAEFSSGSNLGEGFQQGFTIDLVHPPHFSAENPGFGELGWFAETGALCHLAGVISR